MKMRNRMSECKNNNNVNYNIIPIPMQNVDSFVCVNE